MPVTSLLDNLKLIFAAEMEPGRSGSPKKPPKKRSPSHGSAAVLGLIMSNARQLSVTAAPKVYRALIIHLDSPVN